MEDKNDNKGKASRSLSNLQVAYLNVCACNGGTSTFTILFFSFSPAQNVTSVIQSDMNFQGSLKTYFVANLLHWSNFSLKQSLQKAWGLQRACGLVGPVPVAHLHWSVSVSGPFFTGTLINCLAVVNWGVARDVELMKPLNNRYKHILYILQYCCNIQISPMWDK